MKSFHQINYSLRPSKTIQRQIIFEGIRLMQSCYKEDDPVYIGLGSIWFTDFIMAHKILGIHDMISIEQDRIGYSRAVFNAPFATVQVKQGYSSQVLRSIFADGQYQNRPWVVWLDYDTGFDENLRDDIRSVIERSPSNTIVLITFDARGKIYGRPVDRNERLCELFGDLVPSTLSNGDCRDQKIQRTLARLVRNLMMSTWAETGRSGRFIPAFKIIYRDTADMVTVGGILASSAKFTALADLVSSPLWRCILEARIVAPHLTIRESTILRSQLPCDNRLSRSVVQSLGFDLEDEQIEVFQRYYREYPEFAQIIT